MATESKPTATAMEGDGFYNRNSAMQAAGIARVLPIWEKVAASVPVGVEPLAIADFGSSQGRNSMAPMRIAIAALRAKSHPDRPVQVIHTDLPSNDFASLFQALNYDSDSYLTGEIGIFPSAVGRSYFEPIITPASVHLGWNSWTLRWLSCNPTEVDDHVLAWYGADKSAKEAVHSQAALDWKAFIAARAHELRPGAKLFCLFAASENDRRTWEWLFGQLWASIVDIKDAGLLTDQEVTGMTLPLFGRTLEDIKEPFSQDGSFSGVSLEAAEVVTTPDPFWQEFQKTGDAKRLGKCWAGIWRGAVGPTLASALSSDRDRAAVLDALFSKFAARIAAEPREQQNAIAIVILRKS